MTYFVLDHKRDRTGVYAMSAYACDYCTLDVCWITWSYPYENV